MQPKHKPTENKGINEEIFDQEGKYTHFLKVHAPHKDYEKYAGKIREKNAPAKAPNKRS
jgi:hypothetical protein